MNYLGHAYLSFGDAEIITGNMIGDHVKGLRSLDTFPEGIKKGIILHRKIDTYTDAHLALKKAKAFFYADYHLYAGAIVDTLLDHYLANDTLLFKDTDVLLEFTENIYRQVSTQQLHLPAGFASYFPIMQQYNWLYNYHTTEGVRRAMGGLERRAQHLGSTEKAFQIFLNNYSAIQACYVQFISDIISFVKVEQKK